MVPEDADPFTTPSTNHTTPLRLAVNCCVLAGVSAATRGLIESTVDVSPVPDRAIMCGFAGVLSEIVIVALRAPVALGVKVTVIAQLPFGARDDPQFLV
jgi:hypothetical protein